MIALCSEPEGGVPDVEGSSRREQRFLGDARDSRSVVEQQHVRVEPTRRLCVQDRAYAEHRGRRERLVSNTCKLNRILQLTLELPRIAYD